MPDVGCSSHRLFYSVFCIPKSAFLDQQVKERICPNDARCRRLREIAITCHRTESTPLFLPLPLKRIPAVARLRSMERELKRMVQQCGGGTVTDCRIIEVLADHSKCLNDQHAPRQSQKKRQDPGKS